MSQSGLTMPKNAQLEQKWGVQFKSVTLLADTGVVDVRYTVFDVSKAEALHTNGRTGLHCVSIDRSVRRHFYMVLADAATEANRKG